MINIPADTRQNLYKYLGEETDGIITQTQKRLEVYARKWGLLDVAFFACEANLLFSCK